MLTRDRSYISLDNSKAFLEIRIYISINLPLGSMKNPREFGGRYFEDPPKSNDDHFLWNLSTDHDRSSFALGEACGTKHIGEKPYYKSM